MTLATPVEMDFHMSNTLRIAICVMGALLATDAFAQAANEAPEAAAPAEEAVAAEETPAV